MTVSDLFQKVLFLFGAGATKAAGCLLSQEMFTDLKGSISKLEDQTKARLFDEIYQHLMACLEYQNSIKNYNLVDQSYGSNIEDFVSLLRKIENRDYIIPSPLLSGWNDKIVRFEIEARTIFSDFLGFIEDNLYSKWLEGSHIEGTKALLRPIHELLKNAENFCIHVFTLNYDLVLERFFNTGGITNLDTGFVQGIWSNGFRDTHIRAANQHSESKIHYYKLHGSLDWYKSDTGQIRCVTQSQSKEKPLVIFGHDNKMLSIDPFLSMVFRFKQQLDQAQYYIVIGYSFFDTYVNNLMMQAVNEDPDKKIIIVDPGLEKGGESKFITKLKTIQNNRFIQDIHNVTALDESKVRLLSMTAREFFERYLENDSEPLKAFISQLDEEEDSPF